MERTPVNSSAIAAVGYSELNRVLEVEFENGGVYRYQDVGPRKAENFVNSSSMGAYLNDRIKDSYSVQRVRRGR